MNEALLVICLINRTLIELLLFEQLIQDIAPIPFQ